MWQVPGNKIPCVLLLCYLTLQEAGCGIKLKSVCLLLIEFIQADLRRQPWITNTYFALLPVVLLIHLGCSGCVLESFEDFGPRDDSLEYDGTRWLSACVAQRGKNIVYI